MAAYALRCMREVAFGGRVVIRHTSNSTSARFRRAASLNGEHPRGRIGNKYLSCITSCQKETAGAEQSLV